VSQGAHRRLFVAIFPPEPALDHLGFVVDDLEVSRGAGAAARLIARERWHVTLAFVGPVAPDRVADAEAMVSEAAVGGGRRHPLGRQRDRTDRNRPEVALHPPQ
jgi:2'-5' RNA ligase